MGLDAQGRRRFLPNKILMESLRKSWVRENCALSVQAAIADFYPKMVGMLEKYKGKGLFVHFTDIPKVGINPHPSHRDPVGIYLFPLDHILENFAKYTAFQFKKYMFVCEASPKNVLDISGLDEEGLARHLGRLGIGRERGSRPGQEEKPHPGVDLWYSIEKDLEKEGGGYGMAFRKRLLQLGFDAVRDSSSGAIHSNEPNQLLVLDPRTIRVVDMLSQDVVPSGTEPRGSRGQFYGSSKPALLIAGGLAEQAGMEMAAPPRATRDGYWTVVLKDGQDNRITVLMQIVRSGMVDYKSFAAKFSASWFSQGSEASFEEKGDSWYNFNVDTPYQEVSGTFARKLLQELGKKPPDDASFVDPMALGTQGILGGKIRRSTPAHSVLEVSANGVALVVHFQFSSYSGRVGISGNVRVPKSSIYYIFDPSFNFQLAPYERSEKVVGGVLSTLRDVAAKHFDPNDRRRGPDNRYAMEYIGRVLKFLEEKSGMENSAIKAWFQGNCKFASESPSPGGLDQRPSPGVHGLGGEIPDWHSLDWKTISWFRIKCPSCGLDYGVGVPRGIPAPTECRKCGGKVVAEPEAKAPKPVKP